jgi:hypothetical protein
MVNFIFVGCILLCYLLILYEHIIYMICICNPQSQIFLFLMYVACLVYLIHINFTMLILIEIIIINKLITIFLMQFHQPSLSPSL